MLTRRRLIMMFLTLVMMMGTFNPPVQAQDTPRPIREAAIAALNSAIPGIGRPDTWRHQLPGTSSNTNLGCTLAPSGNLGRTVTVYQVWLNYDGTEYLFYVSDDATVVVPCDTKIPTAGGTITITPPATNNCTFSATSANVYTQPNTTSTITTTLTNATGSIIGRSADLNWYQHGAGGWMQTLFITLQGNCSNLPITDGTVVAGDCTITAVNANIRSEPTTTSQLRGTLTNETIAVIGRTADSDWYQILTGEWVAASVVTPAGNCSLAPVTGATLDDFSDCPVDFAGYMPPLLAIGMEGQVDDESDVPNRLRAQPETSAEILTQMRPGTTFTVLGGPKCGSGIVWWQVEAASGDIGWTAESQLSENDYFVNPLDPMVAFACPAGLSGYAPTNISLFDNPPLTTAAINLYAQPSTSSRVIAPIPAGNGFSFLDNGPACNESVVWYQVSYGEIGGWVHETDPLTGAYVLEPRNNLPAITAPFDSQRITSANILNLQPVGIIPIEAEEVTRVAWSPDSTRIAVIADNKVQVVTNFVVDTAINNILTTPVGFDATAIAFNSDGTLLAVGYSTGAIWIANLDTRTVTPIANSHTARVMDLAFNSRNFLSSVSAVSDTDVTTTASTVKVWDIMNLPPTGQAPLLIDATNQPMIHVAFSTDESFIAVSTSNGLQLYNVQTGAVGQYVPYTIVPSFAGDVIQSQEIWGDGFLFGDGVDIYALSTSGGLTTQVGVLLEGGAGVFDIDVTRMGDGLDVYAAVFSRAFGSQLAFYDTVGVEPIHVIDGEIGDIAFSPDGTILAVIQDFELQLWTVTN